MLPERNEVLRKLRAAIYSDEPCLSLLEVVGNMEKLRTGLLCFLLFSWFYFFVVVGKDGGCPQRALSLILLLTLKNGNVKTKHKFSGCFFLINRVFDILICKFVFLTGCRWCRGLERPLLPGRLEMSTSASASWRIFCVCTMKTKPTWRRPCTRIFASPNLKPSWWKSRFSKLTWRPWFKTAENGPNPRE